VKVFPVYLLFNLVGLLLVPGTEYEIDALLRMSASGWISTIIVTVIYKFIENM